MTAPAYAGRTARGAHPSPPRLATPVEPVSPADLATVKKAIELVRKSKNAEAMEIAKLVSDPAARKLIEWAVLRAEDDDFSFERYANFAAANPGWPSTMQFRRKAEAALYQNGASDTVVRNFFAALQTDHGQGPVCARARAAGAGRAHAGAAICA